MKTLVLMLSSVVAFVLIVSIVIQPLTVAALNTYAVDFERDTGNFLADPDSATLALGSQLTVEAWIKPESVSPSSAYVIASKRGASSDRSFVFKHQVDAGGVVQLALQVSSSGGGFDGDTAVNWSPSPLPGNWYHVAAVFNSGSVTYYVNGVQMGSTQSSAITAVHDAPSVLSIGAEMLSGPGDFFDGVLDEVRVWNIARGQSQIMASMSTELTGSETGLVGYWKFNDNADIAPNDLTSYGHEMTDNGGFTYVTDVPFTDAPFIEVRKVVKTLDQSDSDASVALSNDQQLTLALKANTTYVFDGVLFAVAPNGTPDIHFDVAGPSGATARIGYTNDVSESVLDLGETSPRVQLQGNMQTSIHLHGTITTGVLGGNYTVRWSQATANASNPTTVLKGSYLRAEEI